MSSTYVDTAKMKIQPPMDHKSGTANVVGKKKALLIAIASKIPGYPALHEAHRDVRAMRELLLEMYHYQPNDITLLIDDDIADHPQPTRANILKAMALLVEDAESGDEFFLHYCGHSMQIENRTDSEEDGMDECLVPLDGEEMRIIMNNEIHNILLVPLPIGSRLVALFDTCHSKSLLDLKHYRCNRVCVPWISTGKRSSEAERMIDRRNALARRVVQTSWTSSSSAHTKYTLTDVGCETQQPTQPVPQSPIDALSRRVSSTLGGTPVVPRATISRLRTTSIRCPPGNIEKNQGVPLDVDVPPIVPLVGNSRFLPDDAIVCESPIPRWPCDGWCRESWSLQADDGVKADVMSLAACRDSELAWDFRVSNVLIELLQADPNPTLKDLLTKLSHELHKLAFTRHGNSRNNKTKRNDYEAILKERIAIYNGSTVSLSTQSGPTTTFPTPVRRQSKLLTRALRALKSHDPELQSKLLVQARKALKKSREAKGIYDQYAFQHPELSSRLPLNMESRWRM